ncbi:MAG: hypothetical protein RSB96_02290, partial [Oscillospiraceae bacterium]
MKKILVITSSFEDITSSSFLNLKQQEGVSVSFAFISAASSMPISIPVYPTLKEALSFEKSDYLYFFDGGTLLTYAFLELIAYATTFHSDFVCCSVKSESSLYLSECTGSSFYATRGALVDEIEQKLAYTTANKLFTFDFVTSHLSFLTDNCSLHSAAAFSLRSLAIANTISVNGKLLCEKETIVPSSIATLSLSNLLDWIDTTLKGGQGKLYESICVVAFTNAIFLGENDTYSDFLADVTTLIRYTPFMEHIHLLASDSYPFTKIFAKLALFVNETSEYELIESSYLYDMVLYGQYFASNIALLAHQCILRLLY